MNSPAKPVFQSFQFSVADDVFNTPVSGGSYLPVGHHEVRVINAEFEVGEYGPQFKVEFQSEKGESIRDFINLIAKNDESKQQTGTRPHYKYLLLGQSLIADPVGRLQFLNKTIPSNPNAIDCIKNTRLIIEVVAPIKGYSAVDVAGGKMLLDLETNEYYTDDVYATFEDAKRAAEAMGIKRGFNKVKSFSALNAETQAENLAIMQPILGMYNKASAAPAPKAAATRPTSTLQQARAARPT